MVRVLLDDIAQAEVIGKFFLAFLQVQGHNGATRFLLGIFERKAALSIRFPAHGFALVRTGSTAGNADLVCNDETGIKTNTELADHLSVFGLVTGQ